MAGELAITLVNTARVLEMLVAIVLVSKYFTTPIADKAVTICWREQNSETMTSTLTAFEMIFKCAPKIPLISYTNQYNDVDWTL